MPEVILPARTAPSWRLRLIFAKMVGYPDQMTKLESNPSPARGRVFASLLKPFAMLAALLLLPVAVQAGWFTKVMGAAEQAAPRATGLGVGTLAHAALHLRSLPVKADG